MVGYILFLTSTNTSVLYGSIFYKPWERSRPPRSSAHGTSIMSNPTTNAPLSSGLDWLWPTLGAFSQHGYSMIHRGSGRRQRSIWRLALECVCSLPSTESGWWRRTGGRRGSGLPGVKKTKRHKGDALEMVTWTLSIHSDRSCTTYRAST